jgi:hypothetical protein
VFVGLTIFFMFNLNVRMFYRILSIPQNIVMNMPNITNFANNLLIYMTFSECRGCE